jgi:hypothetical protein
LFTVNEHIHVVCVMCVSKFFLSSQPLPATTNDGPGMPQRSMSRERQIAAQSLTWTVEAKPDGRLVDKTSDAEVTYFYWEATYVMLFCVARPPLISFSLSDIWLFPPVSEPRDSILLRVLPDRQNPELPRRGTQGTHTTRRGPYLFHRIRFPPFFRRVRVR